MRTFNSCSNLTSITIGKGVTYINSDAFRYCSKALKYVFSAEMTAVPTLASTSAFTGINANCKIYVPDALYDTWITNTNWSTYALYIAKLSEMPTE
jgi:hypothetical protein